MDINKSIDLFSMYYAKYINDDLTSINDSDLISLVVSLRNFSDDHIFVDSLFKENIYEKEKISDFCLFVECEVEKILANRFIKGDTDLVQERIKKAIPSHICESEFLADSSKSIVIVGSGAVPLSALIYHSHTALDIVCVDFDQDSIELSKKVICAFFGTSDALSRFRFICGDAKNCDFGPDPIEAVLLSSHCIGKLEVLKNIHKQSSLNSKLIIRRPKLLYRYIYENINLDDIEPFYQLVDGAGDFEESPVLNKPYTLTKVNNSIASKSELCDVAI